MTRDRQPAMIFATCFSRCTRTYCIVFLVSLARKMRGVLVCIALCLLAVMVKSFSPLRSGVAATRTRSVLSMGGGRSPDEVKGKHGVSTTKTMFKELRSKLNKAAEAPGFFDTADGKPVSL